MISAFSWGSPVGLGIFLICFGIFIYLASKADNSKKKKKIK